ncbi:hypothetical protein SEPCBS119000_006368 [Sporothrix epigloea]|uniref:Major facilitator superfamily (MFS) profile domain-containing protein n=1 Tax=Sporothrix epigloea TaxID=1892477 RepID=A0ABP0E2M7_9PEZI
MSDNEKIYAGTLGAVDNSNMLVAISDPDAHLSEDERKVIDRKLVLRLDIILIPWLSLLYLVAFLDRTNIGNAKIAHLETELGLSTSKYNATLTIFFISYSIFEPITNILIKRLRPSIFIPIIMVTWGASMLSMGFVTNFGGLLAARWFLGFCESGLFPGINYYLSCWYKRSEFGIRAAIFFSAAAVSGSFGGLLAAAIGLLDGKSGLAGWAWIFVIEGVFTILLGILSFFVIQDFPDRAQFLSTDDRARVICRLKFDQQSSAAHEDFRSSYMSAALRDWKTWLSMIIYMGCDMALYAFAMFLPSIVINLGWGGSVVHSQLMSVPPYVVAAIFTVTIGYIADCTRQRGLCNICTSFIGIIGFSMLISTPKAGVQYAGTFLAAIGIYPCIANTITWVANNTEGVYKRGVVLGLVIGWGNLNGAVSSNIYFDPPRYFVGHGVILAYMAIFLLGGSLLMTVLLRRENAKRKRGERDSWLDGLDEIEIEMLGDQRPDFQYTI